MAADRMSRRGDDRRQISRFGKTNGAKNDPGWSAAWPWPEPLWAGPSNSRWPPPLGGGVMQAAVAAAEEPTGIALFRLTLRGGWDKSGTTAGASVTSTVFGHREAVGDRPRGGRGGVVGSSAFVSRRVSATGWSEGRSRPSKYTGVHGGGGRLSRRQFRAPTAEADHPARQEQMDDHCQAPITCVRYLPT